MLAEEETAEKTILDQANRLILKAPIIPFFQ
jgi:hypothetical protein